MAEVTLALIEKWEPLDALAVEWDQLAAAIPTATFFQSATATLSLALRDDPRLHPRVVVARHPDGTLAGVLPLGLRRDGTTRRTLVPLTEWHASLFDMLAATPAISQRLWSEGTRLIRGWDAADLRYIPDSSPLRDATIGGGGWSHDDLTKHVALDAGALAATPPKFAVEMRRLGRRGSFAFSSTTTAGELPRVIARFADLHTARWEGEGAAAEYATDAGRARLTALLSRATESGAARVGTLRLDEEILAIHLAFRWHDVQHTWRIAHATGWKAYSIGMMLYDLMFRAAAEEGCQIADLGRGDEAYKERWQPTTQPLWRYTTRGPTLRGRLGQLKARLTSRGGGTHAQP